MKKYTIIITLLAMLLPSALSARNDGDAKITVMSYNIRCGASEDGTNSWPYRYALSAMMMLDQKPDVMGIQEGLRYQLEYLREYVKPYKYVGKGREDGKAKGEYAAIMYNGKTTSLGKWGTFWLSETPDRPGMGWDAACPRTATWALMTDRKSGRKYYFVCTHLDHQGREAREKGMQLILERISQINRAGLPVIIAGDFNADESDSALAGLGSAMTSCRSSAFRSDDGITYNAWGRAKEQSRIDHIYWSGFDHCREFSVHTKKYEGRAYISDHFPVVAVMYF